MVLLQVDTANLGFFVIEARRQYLPESSLIDPDALTEIAKELGIADIVQGTDASHTTRIEKGLQTLQRAFDLQTSIDRWKKYSADNTLTQLFGDLVQDTLPNELRDTHLSELRAHARDLGTSLGW